MSSKSPSDAPWHLWLVGGILLLYALLAAYDSAMTLSQGEAYMRASGMTGSQLNYFTGLPLWVQIASFLSTWLGLLGAILLLARRKAATVAFLIAAFATFATCAYHYTSEGDIEAMGAMWPMPAIIAVAFLGASYYAYHQRRHR